VLLLGYIFYLLSRKNTDVGFQDFLIDSVFHTKKIETPSGNIRTPDGANIIVPQAPTIVVTQPVITADPLASYTPPVVEAKSLTVTTPTLDPLASTEPATIPSWLQVPKVEEKGATPPTEETTPVIEPAEVPIIIETPLVPIIDVAENAVPSWLQVSDTPKEEISAITDTEIPTDILVPAGDLALGSPTSTPEPASDALPDWLVDSLKSPETTPVTEAIEDPIIEVKKPEKKKKPKKIETPKEVPTTHSTVSGDIPDWLK
jgi:hypothetical protein